MDRAIYIGYDSREAECFAVCRHSLRQHAPDVPIYAIALEEVRNAGLYWRPTSRRTFPAGASQLWDDISDAAMSTEFAISRFLTPVLAKAACHSGWAMFLDSDILARADIDEIFAAADPTKAVMCVKHEFVPATAVKMDGQLQQPYARKNWSSVMLFNLAHPANRALTVNMINSVPGRDLHRFCWLGDDDIGGLHPKWNYLVGHTLLPEGVEPALVHFTEGGPWFAGYADVEYAEEWRAARTAWLNEGRATTPVNRSGPPAHRRANGANGELVSLRP
ncbi:MAG TPA: glycosyltransferase [Xanthobacteraceae bacterium]|nr:glycosyltransferase [Xanthobacteraceae bacterium]